MTHRLRRSLGGQDSAGGLRCAVSIGVAQMRHENTVDNLIHRADTALYRAKNTGKSG